MKTSKICLGSNPNRGGGGHLGDRNHAVYIPYCDYFATSDKILIQALKSEFEIVMVENNLHLFRIKKEANRK